MTRNDLEALRDIAAVPLLAILGFIAVIPFVPLVLLCLMTLAGGEWIIALCSFALACIAIRNIVAATRAIADPGWGAIAGILAWSGVALGVYYLMRAYSSLFG